MGAAPGKNEPACKPCLPSPPRVFHPVRGPTTYAGSNPTPPSPIASSWALSWVASCVVSTGDRPGKIANRVPSTIAIPCAPIIWLPVLSTKRPAVALPKAATEATPGAAMMKAGDTPTYEDWPSIQPIQTRWSYPGRLAHVRPTVTSMPKHCSTAESMATPGNQSVRVYLIQKERGPMCWRPTQPSRGSFMLPPGAIFTALQMQEKAGKSCPSPGLPRLISIRSMRWL